MTTVNSLIPVFLFPIFIFLFSYRQFSGVDHHVTGEAVDIKTVQKNTFTQENKRDWAEKARWLDWVDQGKRELAATRARLSEEQSLAATLLVTNTTATRRNCTGADLPRAQWVPLVPLPAEHQEGLGRIGRTCSEQIEKEKGRNKHNYYCFETSSQAMQEQRYQLTIDDCDMPTSNREILDGLAAVLNGKTIMFVGDSLMRQQVTALYCLLEEERAKKSGRSKLQRGQLEFFEDAWIGHGLGKQTNSLYPFTVEMPYNLSIYPYRLDSPQLWTERARVLSEQQQLGALVLGSNAWWNENNFPFPSNALRLAVLNIQHFVRGLQIIHPSLQVVWRDGSHAGCSSGTKSYSNDGPMRWNWIDFESRNHDIACLFASPAYSPAASFVPSLPLSSSSPPFSSSSPFSFALPSPSILLLQTFTLSQARAGNNHPGSPNRQKGGTDCLHFCAFERENVPEAWNRQLLILLRGDLEKRQVLQQVEKSSSSSSSRSSSSSSSNSSFDEEHLLAAYYSNFLPPPSSSPSATTTSRLVARSKRKGGVAVSPAWQNFLDAFRASISATLGVTEEEEEGEEDYEGKYARLPTQTFPVNNNNHENNEEEEDSSSSSNMNTKKEIGNNKNSGSAATLSSYAACFQRDNLQHSEEQQLNQVKKKKELERKKREEAKERQWWVRKGQKGPKNKK